MIQDIGNHRFINAWNPRKPHGDDIVFGYRNRKVLMHMDNTFYTVSELSENQELQYLFQIDDCAFYLADFSSIAECEVELNAMRTYEPDWMAFACINGFHLYSWMRHNRYCGICGKEMSLRTNERAMECKHCGNIVYPRLNPAVIVGIVNEKKQLLISRYTSSGPSGMALIAGYVEFGETLEDCVRREVKEETGLNVKDIRYYGSQPWAFSESVLSGFWCTVDGSDEIFLDETELSSARWVNAEDLPVVERPISLTATMIQEFRRSH